MYYFDARILQYPTYDVRCGIMAVKKRCCSDNSDIILWSVNFNISMHFVSFYRVDLMIWDFFGDFEKGISEVAAGATKLYS
jgi:hypothetical protein